MAKKSQRRPPRYERDQLGCMWGFISMFNFRHGRSPHKLLVDRRHNSKRTSSAGFLRSKLDRSTCFVEDYKDTHNGENKYAGAEFVKPSVKKLIEDELFTEIASKTEKDDVKAENLSENEHEVFRRTNWRRKSKNRNKSCSNINDLSTADQSLKHRSASSLDIDNMVEEFYRGMHEKKSMSSGNDAYKERLSEFIKFLISQKLVHGNSPTEGSEIHTSQDLMEAFQILGCDEDFFLKLLQDPDSVVKDSQETPNFQLEEEDNAKPVEAPHSSKQRSFFRRKSKPQRQITGKETNASPASERIVILKPGIASLSNLQTETKEPSERISSHFFFAEVKRKLKHAMRKEQRGDGTSEIFSQRHQSSGSTNRMTKESFGRSVPTKDHFFIEKMAKPSIRVEDDSGHSKERLSKIYVEAKKHLFEMLNNGEKGADLSSKHVPRTLGKILSLPEYLSPLGSPGRNLQQNSLGLHRRSVSEELQKVDENKPKEKSGSLCYHLAENREIQPSSSDNVSGDVLELAPLVLSPDDKHANKVEETSTAPMSSEAARIIEAAKEIDITTVQEETKEFSASSEEFSSSITRSDENNEIPITNDETVHCRSPVEDSCVEIQLTFSPPGSPSNVTGTDCRVGRADMPARSSPVSVLDPLFTEDDISPARNKSHYMDLQVQPLRVRFDERDAEAEERGILRKPCTDQKEMIIDYVRMVLECSEPNSEEFFFKSLSSDQLLAPSLLESVQFFPNQLCPDQELLLDCINEVLLEFCGNPPWASFANPRVRPPSDMKSTIHEVQERVYWNVLPLPLPRTLDQIVRKDFSKSGNWMDLRADTDCIGTETGEIILDELLEEVAVNCLDFRPGINCSVDGEF